MRTRQIPATTAAQAFARWGRSCWLGLPGCESEATQLDHIKPFAAGGHTTVENLRPVCRHCNALRGDRILNGHPARIHVVTGPPSAGKTTFVDDNRQPGDMVLDFDALAQAICPGSTPRTRRTALLTEAAQAGWRGVYGRLVRAGQPATIWIIKAVPWSAKHPGQLDEWIALDYQIHVIDPGADTVFTRMESEHRPEQARLAARRWYSLHVTQQLVDARLALRRSQLARYGLAPAGEASARPAW